jgi:hypothetical protein
VSAAGGFDTSTWQSTGISYSVEVSSDGPSGEIVLLLEVVDDVAEIPRATRAGATSSGLPEPFSTAGASSRRATVGGGRRHSAAEQNASRYERIVVMRAPDDTYPESLARIIQARIQGDEGAALTAVREISFVPRDRKKERWPGRTVIAKIYARDHYQCRY